MPVYNLSVPATSPLIQYRGNWNLFDDIVQLIPSNDGPAPSVSFAFNGTGLYLSGGRNNLLECDYSIDIDGTTSNKTLPHSGNFVSNDEIFFSDAALLTRPHTVRIFNFSGTCSQFGFGWMNFTLGDGQTSTNSTDITLDRTNVNNVTLVGNWPSGTDTSTLTYNGSATVSFYGNGISVYGVSGPNFGPYNVSLDGAPYIQMNASATNGTDDQVMFFAHNLTRGSHNVVLVNNDLEAPTRMAFLRAVVTTYEPARNSSTSPTSDSSTPATSAVSSPTNTPATTSSKSHTGAIAGGVIGGLAFLALLSLLFLCSRRYFRRRYGPPVYKDDILSDNPAPATATAATVPTASPGPQPEMEELDMPPPNYRRIYPSEAGNASVADAEETDADVHNRPLPDAMHQSLQEHVPAEPPSPSPAVSGRRRKGFRLPGLAGATTRPVPGVERSLPSPPGMPRSGKR